MRKLNSQFIRNVVLALLILLLSSVSAKENKKPNILISYFSYGGNTLYIAEKIQALVGGATMHEIKTTPYPEEYRKCTEYALEEKNNNARPVLIDNIKSIDEYDVIFVGFPNWWATMPMPLFTFLEGFNFDGKKLIPFVTHGGSSFGQSTADFKKCVPKGTILDGISIHRNVLKTDDTQKRLETWVKSLSL